MESFHIDCMDFVLIQILYIQIELNVVNFDL